jgi:opacity protein-like surface antigen
MKKVYLATLLGTALAVSSAQASTNLCQSGFKVGLGGGYGAFKSSSTTKAGQLTPAVTLFSNTSDLGGDGGFGRFFLGYDFVMKNGFVLGLELGAAASNIKGTKAQVFLNNPAQGNDPLELKAKDTFDAALRIGFVVRNAFTPYIKLGAESTKFQLRQTSGSAAAPAPNNLADATTNKRLTGFLVGAGVEVPVTRMFHVGAEYTYSHFNSVTATSSNPLFVQGGAVVGATESASAKPRMHRITARLMLKI